MTCKDCVHYGLCYQKGFSYNDNLNKPVETICEYFKDKSKYIELACNVGDIVYRVDIETNNIEVITIENIIIANEEIILRYDSYDGVICHLSNIIEKTLYLDCFAVFLTKSEAEQKLEELKEINECS